MPISPGEDGDAFMRIGTACMSCSASDLPFIWDWIRNQANIPIPTMAMSRLTLMNRRVEADSRRTITRERMRPATAKSTPYPNTIAPPARP